MLELASVQQLHQHGHRPGRVAVARFDHANLPIGDAQKGGKAGLGMSAAPADGLEGGRAHSSPSDSTATSASYATVMPVSSVSSPKSISSMADRAICAARRRGSSERPSRWLSQRVKRLRFGWLTIVQPPSAAQQGGIATSSGETPAIGLIGVVFGNQLFLRGEARGRVVDGHRAGNRELVTVYANHEAITAALVGELADDLGIDVTHLHADFLTALQVDVDANGLHFHSPPPYRRGARWKHFASDAALIPAQCSYVNTENKAHANYFQPTTNPMESN